MKKVFYSFALLALSLMSCESNSDDDTNPPETSTNDTILPTQVEIVYSDGETETIQYTYEGKKLIKEESTDGFFKDYIYEDNRLIEINYYEGADFEILESFTYDSQDRVSTITTNILGTGVYEDSQIYNEDGSVITQSSLTFPDSASSTITITDGNIINFTEADVFASTYTYDDKNGVFKNVELREQLVTIDSENNDALSFTLNNISSESIVENSTTESEDYTYTMTYTSFDYPRTVEEDGEGDITTFTYTYNND